MADTKGSTATSPGYSALLCRHVHVNILQIPLHTMTICIHTVGSIFAISWSWLWPWARRSKPNIWRSVPLWSMSSACQTRPVGPYDSHLHCDERLNIGQFKVGILVDFDFPKGGIRRCVEMCMRACIVLAVACCDGLLVSSTGP
jgi:hypothetical protein